MLGLICGTQAQYLQHRDIIAPWHVGSSLPDQRLNLHPLLWEGRFFITGPPGTSFPFKFGKVHKRRYLFLMKVRVPTCCHHCCCCCCCCCQVTSVVSDSVRPHRQQPTRLPHPWDSPGKNAGVGLPFPSPMQESEK